EVRAQRRGLPGERLLWIAAPTVDGEGAGRVAQDLGPEPAGRSALDLPGAPPEDRGAARLRRLRDLLGEPGLADARLAGEEDDVAVAVEGPIERALEIGQLSGPAMQAAPPGHEGTCAVGGPRRPPAIAQVAAARLHAT